MRTIIDIFPAQKKLLFNLAKKKNVSMAELIRRAISEYLNSVNMAEGEEECFGLWKNKKIDGIEYQRKLRTEWER